MVRCEQFGDGRQKVTPVANFTARIIRDLVLEREGEGQREFAIEAELDGQRLAFTVGAVEFGRMGWVVNKLGPRAIVYPGQQQHARTAIQWLSGMIRQERIFTRTGWHREGSEWTYVHADGTLKAHGQAGGLPIQLPAPMENYRLQPAVDNAGCLEAIRSSLGFLALAGC